MRGSVLAALPLTAGGLQTGSNHEPVRRISPLVPISSICFQATQRTEALAAVQFAIDELKARVPIWKREVYMAQGEGAISGSAWKVNRECAFPAAHK